MERIEILIRGKGRATAELDSRNPGISEALLAILPLEAEASLWGEEIYFHIPLDMEDEDSSPASEPGDISYWSPGPAFCIFFGKTQPYSEVNHLGKVVDGIEIFKKVEAGDRIVLSRA